jgi:hypothetical protein
VTDQYSLFDPDIPSNDNDGSNDEESKQHTFGLHISYIDNDENKLLASQKELLK